MAKKKTNDQKRAAKLKERARQKRANGIDQFRSKKYQGAEWVDAVYNTESAILDAHFESDDSLTDRHVWDALTQLAELCENDPTDPRTKQMEVPYAAGQEVPYLIGAIVNRWTERLSGQAITNKDFAGVLRTILDSVHTHTRLGMTKGGYLVYLERFLGQLNANRGYSAIDILNMYASSPEGRKALEGGEIQTITEVNLEDEDEDEDEDETPQKAN